MSFANINIGTTPGDHSGDPLRTAFTKINNNFQQIANGNISLNLNAPVQSVAGRTGNVIITVNDVVGAVTAGNVQAAIVAFSTSYPTKADLASNVAALVNGAPSNLNTLGEIATSIGNDPAFSATINANLSTINTQITNLWTNAAVQDQTLTALHDDITAANIAIAQNTSNIQILFSNAASQAATLATLTSNASSQASDLITLTANAATQAANLVSLFSNATTQDSSLSNLLSNAAAQDASLSTLLANAASQQTTLTALLANTSTLQSEINGANAAIVTANTAVVNYLNMQIAAVNQGWGSNAQSVQSQLFATNAAIVTANTALKSYVDSSNSSMKSYVDAQNSALSTAWTANAGAQANQLTGANAAIVTANTALKGYVDSQVSSVTTAWTANAATQQGQITTLQSQVYGDSNVAAYLPTYTGNLSAGNINVGHIAGNSFIGGNINLGMNNGGPASTYAVLTVNANPEKASPATGVIQAVALVGRGTQITLDTVADTIGSSILTRRSRGTMATPTAAQSGDWLGSFITKGYGTTTYQSTTSPGIAFVAGENFTDSAQGTFAAIYTTRVGANVASVHSKFETNGNLVIANGSPSTGLNTGALLVNGGASISGNIFTSANINSGSWVTANLGITSNLGVYSPRYFFANGNPFTLPFDIDSADAHTQTYGGNAYIANIQMHSATFTGDGSGLPLTFDYTQTIATHTLQAEGTLVANASTQATSVYNGALLVPNGGAGIAGNVFVSTQPGTHFQVGQGGTYFANVIAQFTSDIDGPGQLNMQNLHQSANASSEIVVRTDNSTEYTKYAKLGICNSIYSNPNKTAYLPNDGFLNVDSGNLLLSAERLGTMIKFINGGYQSGNIIGTWDSNVFTISTAVTLGNVLQFANLTTSQINAVPSPQPGMTAYNYTTGNIQVYNGTKWANVTLS